MFESAENKLLKRALAAYAGQHVLSRVLLMKEKALALTSAQVEVTLLYTDVVSINFGNPSLDNQRFHTMTNRYSAMVMSTIEQAGGCIDDLRGTAISAFWSDAEHAESACACAQKLRPALDAMNIENESLQLPVFKMRIGVHSGAVLLGNYGAKERMTYSVLGDAIATASNICNLANSYYDFSIVLSEPTRRRLSDRFQPKAIEAVRVKGLEEPLQLYGL